MYFFIFINNIYTYNSNKFPKNVHLLYDEYNYIEFI